LEAGRIIPEGAWTDSVVAGLARDIARKGFVREALSFAAQQHADSGAVAIIAHSTVQLDLEAALDAVASMRGQIYRAAALATLGKRFKEEALKAKPQTRQRLARIAGQGL
jgi:hypothetical protein